MAARFVQGRSSDGAEFRGRLPEDSSTVACTLSYPREGLPLEGPLFKGNEMEEKWDIYAYDDSWYFVRSWGRKLSFRTSVRHDEDLVVLHEIDVGAERQWGDVIAVPWSTSW